MKDDYVISLYLDTRRPKSNGKYPVKLRLWIPSLKKQMLYPTNLEFTEKVFTTIRTSKKLSKEQKTLRLELNAIENKAVDAAKETVPFTVEDFERRLYRSKGDGVRVEYLFNEAIQDLTAHKQVGTASTYELSMKSIREFVEVELKQGFESLALHDITAKWLNDYEYFMTEVKGRSLTTVSMYVRALRAIFNVAIENKDFKKERYPFGKKRYQVPASTKLKRALNKEQLSILFNAKPKTPEQEKARDFWFLSYALNGMNMKDIALLRYKDIREDKIHFIRAKTKRTSKSDLRTIEVHLNEFSKRIIRQNGHPKKGEEDLVFPILSEGLSPEQVQARVKNFTRFINQHLKRLAKDLGLPEDISTYWARHSFATIGIRSGASMEFMRESLGHKDLKTTQNYFDGFEDEAKREFADQIMDFSA